MFEDSAGDMLGDTVLLYSAIYMELTMFGGFKVVQGPFWLGIQRLMDMTAQSLGLTAHLPFTPGNDYSWESFHKCIPVYDHIDLENWHKHRRTHMNTRDVEDVLKLTLILDWTFLTPDTLLPFAFDPGRLP